MRSVFVVAAALCSILLVQSVSPTAGSGCIKRRDIAAGSTLVFADMHDGDQKAITFGSDSITIAPYGNDEKWQVIAAFNEKTCSAVIDFNVPGKPSPPPVNLTATVWGMETYAKKSQGKNGIEFTDPTGTIGKPGIPLNYWVEI